MVFPGIVKATPWFRRYWSRPIIDLLIVHLPKSFAYLIQELSRRQAGDFSYLPFPHFRCNGRVAELVEGT
jgi:hypothetical protein